MLRMHPSSGGILPFILSSGALVLLLSLSALTSHSSHLPVELQEDPLDKAAELAAKTDEVKKQLQGVFNQHESPDLLTRQIDKLKNAKVEEYKRWVHLDPEELRRQRAAEASAAQARLANDPKMLPVTYYEYNPEHHVYAESSKYLLDSDPIHAALGDEAEAVLGSYEKDLAKKASPFAGSPNLVYTASGSPAEGPVASSVVDMRGTMAKIKQEEAAAEPIPEFVKPPSVSDKDPSKPALSSTNEQKWWTPNYAARQMVQHPVRKSIMQGATGERSDAAVAAYFNAIKHHKNAQHAMANAFSAYAFARPNPQADYKEYVNAVSPADRWKAMWQHAVSIAEPEVPEMGPEDIRAARIARIGTEDAMEEAGAAHVMPIHQTKAGDVGAWVFKTPTHGRIGTWIENAVNKAIQPLVSKVNAEEAQIKQNKVRLDNMYKHHKALIHHHHFHKGSPYATRIAVNLPGPIGIDHLKLPGGEYAFSFQSPHPPHVHHHHHVHGTMPHPHHHVHHHHHHFRPHPPKKNGHKDLPHKPDSPSKEAKDADDQILDSRVDMDNGVDKKSVQDAALSLQKKLIQELEAKTGVSAAPEDDVLDSATGMTKGTDHKAVKSAAIALQKRLVEELESQGQKQEAAKDSVLHSATDMSNGVDTDAVKAAAVSLQKKLLSELDGVKKDSVAFHKLLHKAGLRVQGRVNRAKKPSLSQEVREKLRAAGRPGRTQMLSEEMLLPINTDPDLSDKFKAKHDDKEEKEIMHDRLGSIDRTDEDLEAEGKMHAKMDTVGEAGQHAPTSFDGGLGSQSHMHPAGAQAATWYASWWDNPNLEDIAEAVAKTLGDGHHTKQKLVEEGVNVRGWEPGRTTDEIREDHLTGKEMPAGLWEEDGTPAFVPDQDIHHPCGSEERVRPCAEEDKSQPPEEMDGNIGTVPGNGTTWVDPMPYEALKHDRDVREGKDENEDEEGDEEEEGDDEEEN